MHKNEFLTILRFIILIHCVAMSLFYRQHLNTYQFTIIIKYKLINVLKSFRQRKFWIKKRCVFLLIFVLMFFF